MPLLVGPEESSCEEGTPPAALPTGGENIGGGSSLQPSSAAMEFVTPGLCCRAVGEAEGGGAEGELGLTIQ